MMKPFGQFLFSFSLIFSPLNSPTPIEGDGNLPLSSANDSNTAYLLEHSVYDDDLIADNWSPEIDSLSDHSDIYQHLSNAHPRAAEFSSNAHSDAPNTKFSSMANNVINSQITNAAIASLHSSESNAHSGLSPEGQGILGAPTQTEPEKKERRAYLATYPRSGNHWTRYLIEEATHIATSSVYCDFNPQHLNDPFEWGGYCCEHGYEGHCRYAEEDEPVLIKTHVPALPHMEFDGKPYFLTIRIVRHPVDSFYSNYKFLEMLHERFNIPGKVELTTDLIKYFIRAWREFQDYWDQHPNVLTIRYEYMLDHPEEALKIMLRNLGYDDHEEDIKRAVAMHPPEGSSLKHLSRFSQEDLKLIQEELSDLLEKYDYTIPLDSDPR